MITNDHYKIRKNTDTTVVVFCTSYENPTAYLSSIEEDLRKIQFEGDIIFDLLLSNGYNSNRFVRARFDNYKIDRLSMKVIKFVDISSDLLDKIHKYYQDNPQFVEDSVLLEKEKSRLLSIC